QGSADRLAVMGSLNASTDAEDFYSVTLTAGQPATLIVTAQTGLMPVLELFDAAGARLARSVGSAIRDFGPSQTATYYARLSLPSGVSSYSLLLTRGATFNLGPNGTAGSAQDIDRTRTILGSIVTFPLPTEVENNNDIAHANDLTGSFTAS